MPDDRNDFVVLTTLRREFEAATIAEALHAHGVQTETTHADAAATTPGGRPVREHRVLVRAGDLKKAQELLKFIQAQSMHLSWAQESSRHVIRSAGAAPSATVAGSAAPRSGAETPEGASPTIAANPAPVGVPDRGGNPPGASHPHTSIAAGSRNIPVFVAIAVIVVFVIIVLAIMVRPSGT